MLIRFTGHSILPKGGKNSSNCWNCTWVGSWNRGNKSQSVKIQNTICFRDCLHLYFESRGEKQSDIWGNLSTNNHPHTFIAWKDLSSIWPLISSSYCHRIKHAICYCSHINPARIKAHSEHTLFYRFFYLKLFSHCTQEASSDVTEVSLNLYVWDHMMSH